MKPKTKQKIWTECAWLLSCHEWAHSNKKNRYFHNGTWFIHRDALTAILKKTTNARIEKEKESRHVCILCKPKEFKVLSYDVQCYEDYTPYTDRERVLITDDLDYFLYHYSLTAPFGKRKEKELLARIEAGAPAGIRDRAEYFQHHADALELLKKYDRRTFGRFLLCHQHNNARSIQKVLKTIKETSFDWKREYKGTWRHRFLAHLPGDHHGSAEEYFTATEIKAEARLCGPLPDMIRKYAHLKDGFEF